MPIVGHVLKLRLPPFGDSADFCLSLLFIGENRMNRLF